MFEKLMKGPFMVSPFVGIIIKVLLPLLINAVIWDLQEYTTSKLLCPVRGFWRLLALIFAYNGGAVGGLSYVCNGFPYTDLEPIPSADGQTADQKIVREDLKYIL